MSVLTKHGKKNVPAFNEVINNDTNTEVSTNVSTEVGDSVYDIVDSVVNKDKPLKREQVSIYLDEDVKRAFEAFGKSSGKGAKSDLVNTFLRKVLLG